MTPIELAVAIAVVLATAAGIGMLVRSAIARGEPPLALGAAATVLIGLFALAAVQPNLFLLGVPRPVVLGCGYIAALLGWLLALRRRALRLPERRTVLVAALFAVLLEAPVVLAATRPLLSNDAILIWWPKVCEVAAGAWPEMHDVTATHVTPFYPRGMAWLASTASAWMVPDQHLVRLLPVLFTWLLALAMVGAGRAFGRGREALLAALLFVLLPDTAQQCHSGMSDLPIAAAVLCAGIGLSCRRAHAHGTALAVAAALGAAAIKEEGGIVLLVVAGCLGSDLVRHAQLRHRALLGLAALPVLLPFVRLRATVAPTRLDTLGLLLREPDMLLRRAAAVAESLGRELVAPASLALEGERALTATVPWAGWVAVLALAVLVPRRWPRPVVALPAVVLFGTALAIQVVTSVDVRWHMRTTLPRLAIEVAPLLLLAAVMRLSIARDPTGFAPLRAAGRDAS